MTMDALKVCLIDASILDSAWQVNHNA